MIGKPSLDALVGIYVEVAAEEDITPRRPSPTLRIAPRPGSTDDESPTPQKLAGEYLHVETNETAS